MMLGFSFCPYPGLVVTFDPPVYMVEEGGVVNLRVVVSGEADVSISVQFTTEEDSASNGRRSFLIKQKHFIYFGILYR